MALFIDHVNTVLGNLREAPITDLSTDTTSEAYRAQEAVRRAVNRVWNAKQWSFKIRSHDFETVTGQISYPLHSLVGEVFSVLSDTSPYKITTIGESKFDELVPNPTETGVPQYLRLFDMVGALAQPLSSGVVSATSSSASDVTQYVLVKGLILGTYVDYELLTLTGTGTVSGTKLFTSVLAVTKSAPTEGLITVTSGAITVAQLAPQETVHRRRIMRLYPTPDAAYTITVKNFGTAPLLTHKYEDTEIPVKWDYVVDQFAFAFALQAKGQEQEAEFKANFEVASKFLTTDMAAEEFIASEEIITPSRWGMQGDNQWGALPNGYGYIS